MPIAKPRPDFHVHEWTLCNQPTPDTLQCDTCDKQWFPFDYSFAYEPKKQLQQCPHLPEDIWHGSTCSSLYKVVTKYLVETNPDIRFGNPENGSRASILTIRVICAARLKKNSILIDLKEKDVSKYERYGANSFPTTEEPKLSVVFEPWDDDNNGVYLGDEMVVNIQHESLGEWFRILPYKLTTDEDYQKYGYRGGRGGGGRKRGAGRTTPVAPPATGSLMDRRENRELVSSLARKFRSGTTVPLEGELIYFLKQILPSSKYRITRTTTVFKMGSTGDENSSLGRNEMYRFFGAPKSMQAACDRPALTLPPSWYKLHNKDAYPANVKRPGWLMCERLKLLVVPLHDVSERRVRWYMQQFQNDPTYCPTALLYHPRYNGSHDYWSSTIVMDGHHKLQAAIQLSRQISFILVEPRTEKQINLEPFYWSEVNTEKARHYISTVYYEKYRH